MKLALLSVGKYDGYTPPLGLAYLATYLEKYIGFKDTIIIDATYDDIHERINEIKPDIIGISAKTIEYGDAIRAAEQIKKDMDVPIIIGGTHISTLPHSMKPCFDIGVIGEAEETILELMKYYEKEKNFSNVSHIKNLIYFKDKKLKINEKRPLIKDLDSIPYPDRKYINKRYFEKRIVPDNSGYGVLGRIFTARGCPYRCVFCSTCRFWNTVRFHSVDHIIEEVRELIIKYKVNYIDVIDDTFAINKERLKQLCKRFEKEGFTKKVKLSCQLRANIVDDERCALVKKLGVNLVGFGFESGSERILKYIKKGSVTVAANKKAIITCQKHGLKVSGSLIFGTPTETIEDMEETLKFIDFCIEHDVHKLTTFVMTPYPATEMWEIAKQRNKVSDDMAWELLSLQQINNPLLLDERIDVEEFKKIFWEGRKKLDYFRWRAFRRNLIEHPFVVLQKILKSPSRIIQVLRNKHINK